MYALYSLAYSVAATGLLPFEYKRRPPELRPRWIKEKLGNIAHAPRGQVVWLHAVSVGETIASSRFLRELKKQYPAIGIVVSTVTDTGQKVAHEHVGDIATIIYMPFDLRYLLRKAIRTIQPSLFITVETEIWPNAIREMKASGVSVVLVNGRISDSSYKGYRRIKFFLADVLKRVDLFCMQDETYARRMVDMGAPEERVKVTGNFKFDLKAGDKTLNWLSALKGPVIVAGSTHRGEEDLIVDSYKELLVEFPDLILVLAPRHPERFMEVEGILMEKDVEYSKRSELAPGTTVSGRAVLLDVIGELFHTYRACHLAVMGGSFITHGGQNPLEPAFWGKAVVCGPHMENFPFIDDFYREGGALKATRETLFEELRTLLDNRVEREKMGRKAKELCERETGAIVRVVKELERYLHAAV